MSFSDSVLFHRPFGSLPTAGTPFLKDAILFNVDRPAFDTTLRVALPLYQGQSGPCAYLPGRTATHEYALSRHLAPDAYQRLMDSGFRRSGWVVYRPVCEGCRECVPIRVPVREFSARRSQRRVQKRNADVRVTIDAPRATDEKRRLFNRYRQWQHNDLASDAPEEFEEFLYRSPLEEGGRTRTLEMSYWIMDRLAAVGIVDVCPDALSSVYVYFDPVHAKRSLGVFSALCEIEECRRRGLSYWYIGYYIRECRRMNYKSHYVPHEFLGPDGLWRRPGALEIAP